VEKLFETSKKAPGRLAGGDKKSPKKPIRCTLRLLRWCFNLALIPVAGTLIAVSGIYLYVIYAYGDQFDERYPDLIENSAVYDVDGVRIGEFKANENRRAAGEDDLGAYLPQAVVAVEDRRFYEHYGVDLNGIGRAAWEDLRAFGFSQGGSTITEQPTKNLYISQERRGDVSPWRRAGQAALSVAYERGHTKAKILTAYLNTVYFGDGAYGAEEAAETYLGKSAADITIAESAALAGFLHAPSTYLTAGGEGSEKATERRDDVLGRMWGQGMISDEQLDEAEATTLEFSGDQPPDDPDYESFVEAVRREAERKLGAGVLECGGLQIYTTLDPTFQQEAVGSIEETLYASGDPSGRS